MLKHLLNTTHATDFTRTTAFQESRAKTRFDWFCHQPAASSQHQLTRQPAGLTRRPAGKLNNDDVSSNVSNQQEATAQTSSWYWKKAIAKQCRLNKSIRQRFAFALKIQQMACAMIKPAGSHSYLESAGSSLKDNQQANPTADDLAKQFQQQRFSSNDQAVTTQQRCKISNNANSAEATSSSPRKTNQAISSHATSKFSVGKTAVFALPKLCGNFSRILSQSSVQATVQQVQDLGRIRAIDLLPDFTPDSSQEPSTSVI
ncbi:hypothetical protein F511_31975 [Dorcoceras hygrometricum]|uniref:Uncharacterized protein n=1 Tax=Dorcoceras hygrometricum TaxID=472368 RepID=A0A2Z7BTA3_9LAMI|nr:hypothetical protein F511_31975 [Dorcoceras hygrometricum]